MPYLAPKCSIDDDTPSGVSIVGASEKQTRRLWSLWEMMSLYAYQFVALMRQLQNLKFLYHQALSRNGNAIAPALDEDPVNLSMATINGFASVADELDMKSTGYQIATLRRTSYLRLPLDTFMNDVSELAVRVEEDLRSKNFLFIADELTPFWREPDLFKLGGKFKEAHRDIQEAGKCLAVGLGTACVLHLDRGMEIAIRRLAKRLSVPIGPKETWGAVLGKMRDPINKMPDTTQKEKDKRDRWLEAKTHLFHIKEVWRDRPMHGKETYSPARAKEIFEAVKVFMAHLSRL